MNRFLRAVAIAEILIATHLGALCDLWDARAAGRAGKLSANFHKDPK